MSSKPTLRRKTSPRPSSRKTSTKSADGKGRVALGARFANKQVIVEEIDESEVRVIAAAVIPERELWLYQIRDALARVKRGLAQAKARQFSESPPLVPRKSSRGKSKP